MAHLNFLVAKVMPDNYLCWLDLVFRTVRGKKLLIITSGSPAAA